MFEDRWWGDAEWDAAPVPVEPVDLPDDCDLQLPVDPWSVAEVLRAGEHDPVGSDLDGLDLTVLSDDERVAVAVAAQRRVNHYEAVKLAAVACFAGPCPPAGIRGELSAGAFAWSEIAAALHLGEGAARCTVTYARRLVSHLPATLAAMRVGTLSWGKARTVLDATAGMSVAQCRQVQARVLAKAEARNPGQHTQAVGRAVRAVDPDGWAWRREAKLADVAMIRFLHGDGVADILLRHLDAFQAETLWTAATTWARATKATGDPRTLDALRVAALVEWAGNYLTGTPTVPATTNRAPTHDDVGEDALPGEQPPTGGELVPGPRPTRNGQPATVNIVIGLPELTDPTGSGVATVTGSGEPLPADAVADLLTHGAGIRFALTDPDGRLVGVSTRRHHPTALQRVFIALRDLTLRVPGGSTTPIDGHDLDHLDPAGPTEPHNLHAPSRGWHRAKTFGHWTLTANNDATITWTSQRTGRSYTTHPFNHRDGP